ncbi:ThuA domain-containing protein [uncultured Sphingomonas sp.]|uniref:ThuA domain-containing protein n=1 Tax=uncultured Sphingomonas sp. TaxID=158754 RepID=UPI00260924BC|nr:ThuA domain-containing protein [uncultured Sphingomonas sp.]
MTTIDYHAKIRLLVAVRGHPFDRNAFAALFNDMPGITATFVDQPAAAHMMRPDLIDTFDALVLYDMPGLDFAAKQRAAPVPPPAGFTANFTAMLDRGIGVVALHHALAGWPAWPGYAELLGGTFLYRPGTLRGRNRPDSGYRHQVAYTAEVAAPDHPIMADIPPTFPMVDELYLAEMFEDDVIPLLRARHAFTQENFYSATAAIEGRMFSNEGWAHPEGSNLIGWAKRAGNSPLVYLQPGDDQVTYDNPVYRRLVENAIRWVASQAARDWAK